MPTARRDAPLTRRQTEIARLLAQGYSDVEIAQRLGLSPGTVAQHVERLVRKVGARDRHHVAERLVRHTPGLHSASGGL